MHDSVIHKKKGGSGGKLICFNLKQVLYRLIRKKCLDELKGYNDIRGMEDWDLWKRAMSKGYKFYQIPERLYLYRTNTSVIR